jgi:uncharacterized protein YecT (DUF1311 family)
MSLRPLLMIATFALLGALAGHVRASALPPAALPQDIQAVQACLGSRQAMQQASCIGAAANPCLQAADSQQRMTACMMRERVVWDLFLNNDYPEVLKSLPPRPREALRAIQRNFITERDRRCTFVRMASGYSSYIQVAGIEECMMHATAVQWLWLRNFPMKREKQR